MALTAPQAVYARRRVVSDIFGTAAVTNTKAEVDAAMAALVTWLEANAASASAALAGTALAGASAAVKAQALAIAATARYVI